MKKLRLISKRCQFHGYFAAGGLKISEERILNPYSYNSENMTDDEEKQEDIIGLMMNLALEMQFEIKTLEGLERTTYIPKAGRINAPCPRSKLAGTWIQLTFVNQSKT